MNYPKRALLWAGFNALLHGTRPPRGTFVILVSLFLFAAVISFPVGLVVGASFLAGLLASVGLVAAGLGAFAWVERERIGREMLYQLRRAGYLTCLHCGYDLSGHGEEAVCPECGNRHVVPDEAEIGEDAGRH